MAFQYGLAYNGGTETRLAMAVGAFGSMLILILYSRLLDYTK